MLIKFLLSAVVEYPTFFVTIDMSLAMMMERKMLRNSFVFPVWNIWLFFKKW